MGKYSIGTSENEIYFKIIRNVLEFTCYVDENFTRNYASVTWENLNSFKSIIGLVIQYVDCLITRVSYPQIEIDMSMIDARYGTPSTAVREVLPSRELILKL